MKNSVQTYLLFGDSPNLRAIADILRAEHPGSRVHLRSIARWQGDVEAADAVYFLADADKISEAFSRIDVPCYRLPPEEEILAPHAGVDEDEGDAPWDEPEAAGDTTDDGSEPAEEVDAAATADVTPSPAVTEAAPEKPKSKQGRKSRAK